MFERFYIVILIQTVRLPHAMATVAHLTQLEGPFNVANLSLEVICTATRIASRHALPVNTFTAATPAFLAMKTDHTFAPGARLSPCTVVLAIQGNMCRLTAL